MWNAELVSVVKHSAVKTHRHSKVVHLGLQLGHENDFFSLKDASETGF